MNRRDFLVCASGLCAAVSHPPIGRAEPDRASWQREAIKWLETLARDDGGYAWEDQPHSHLTPTFAVIGSYRALNQDPPRKDRLAEFVRTHHPFQLKKLERDLRVFEFQQIQSLLWLGEDVSAFRGMVRGWKEPMVYPAQYESHRYPVFQNELKAFSCRALLGLPLDDLSPAFIEYLDTRRRENGSFNNTPAEDGSDGHVMNTWWGLEALAALGRDHERAKETTTWLRACQRPSGGFTHQPKPEIGGGENVSYTSAALKSLQKLEGELADRGCLDFLFSLRNADGGFGDRPGWPSNPLATYEALDALAVLDGLKSTPPRVPPSVHVKSSLPQSLKVYNIQIEAHGKGSAREVVDLAGALKIHLWCAKNAQPEWIARAQAIADAQKVPVTFAVGNEEYGTWLTVPGMGTYSHTSDVMAPAGGDIGDSLAGERPVTWPAFRERRLRPLENGQGRLIWQFGENEELTRLLLDESLEHGGFAAISTFHFGNPDFTNSEPFLYRYRLKLPFIALQDAHGNEPWWFADMTTGFRTLFLAEEPTWENWLKALEMQWVVAVRHDAVSGQETWMHGGTPEVREFVEKHSQDWQWWDNPKIQRPLVSLVALTPDDVGEVARPDKGISLRIRCTWQNTTQGLPKKPISEFVKLLVDDEPVSAEFVAKRRHNGMLEDHYHQFSIAEPKPGPHVASATVRDLRTGQEITRTLTFTV